MENIKWIFSGFGSEIISSLIGLALGAFGGYKYGVKQTQTIRQEQKAGDNSTQTITNTTNSGNSGEKKEEVAQTQVINQKQEAGNSSTQTITGSSNYGNIRIKN